MNINEELKFKPNFEITFYSMQLHFNEISDNTYTFCVKGYLLASLLLQVLSKGLDSTSAHLQGLRNEPNLFQTCMSTVK